MLLLCFDKDHVSLRRGCFRRLLTSYTIVNACCRFEFNSKDLRIFERRISGWINSWSHQCSKLEDKWTVKRKKRSSRWQNYFPLIRSEESKISYHWNENRCWYSNTHIKQTPLIGLWCHCVIRLGVYSWMTKSQFPTKQISLPEHYINPTGVTNNKNELWKVVRLTSFQRTQLRCVF